MFCYFTHWYTFALEQLISFSFFGSLAALTCLSQYGTEKKREKVREREWERKRVRERERATFHRIRALPRLKSRANLPISVQRCSGIKSLLLFFVDELNLNYLFFIYNLCSKMNQNLANKCLDNINKPKRLPHCLKVTMTELHILIECLCLQHSSWLWTYPHLVGSNGYLN